MRGMAMDESYRSVWSYNYLLGGHYFTISDGRSPGDHPNSASPVRAEQAGVRGAAREIWRNAIKAPAADIATEVIYKSVLTAQATDRPDD